MNDYAPPRLPGDLQNRLDVILQRPLFRRAPRLADDVRALVRDAYGRRPFTAAQQALLDELKDAGLSPAGRIAQESPHLHALEPSSWPALKRMRARYTAPFETGAPWRGAAEADWDESRGDER